MSPLRAYLFTVPRPVWRSAALILAFNGLFLVWLLVKPGKGDLFVAVDDCAVALGPLIMFLLCFYSTSRRWKQGSSAADIAPPARVAQRWAPILLSLSLLSYATGQSIWTYFEVVLHQPTPFPSWGDAGYLGVYPFLLLGIQFLPTRPFSAASRMRVVLDSLIVMTAVVTFSWYFILGPTILQGNGTAFAKIVGAAYPFSDLLMIFCLLLLSSRSSDVSLRPVIRILSFALLMLVLTDSAYDYQTLQGTYTTGGLMNVGWPLGFMLVGLAIQTMYFAKAPHKASAVPSSRQVSTGEATNAIPSVWRALLPYAFVPAVGLLAIYTWHTGGNSALEWGVFLGGGVLIGLVLLRQVFAIRETVTYAKELHSVQEELRTNNHALTEANARLETLATKDPLTELPNHRALLECLEKEIGRARRYGHPLSVLFFDGDHFKRVNDTYGHSVGDTVLQELGRCVRDSLRGGDIIGRYGGEEFMVLLSETDTTEACEVAERMRVAIAAHPFAIGLVEGGVNLAISIGVATFPTHGQTTSEIVDKADQAMYWAKRLGRNQIRTALEAQRASQDSALAATIYNLERRDDLLLDGLSIEQSVRANQLTTIQSLMGLLDLRDQGISSHSYQVSDLAAAIAREMGMEQDAVFAVSTAALLHDIGKIAIPDFLLQKVGPLSANEWALIKQHPELGAQILEVSPYLQNLIPAVGHHHENWDGTGYPDALVGEDIPPAARIIRVSEAYCAMMTTCPYQVQRSPALARSELQRCSGTLFDPDVVQAATRVLARTEKEASAGLVASLVP